MKSTSHWLIFCIASGLLAMTTLVPFLWRSTDQFVRLVNNPDRQRMSDQQPVDSVLTDSRTDPASPHQLGQIPRQQQLVVIPISATRSPAEIESHYPLAPVPSDSPQWIPAAFADPQHTVSGASRTELLVSTDPASLQLTSTVPWRESVAGVVSPQFISVLARTELEQVEAAHAWKEARWPYPAALVEQLAGLCQSAASIEWNDQLKNQLQELCQLSSLADDSSATILLDISQSVAAAPAASDTSQDPVSQLAYQQLVDSLNRRLQVWLLLQRASLPTAGPQAERLPDNKQLLADIHQRLDGADSRQGWLTYLMLDQLDSQLTGESVEQAELRELAGTILQRITSADLTALQQKMLAEPVFARLDQRLRRIACEPVSYKLMLVALEKLEQTGSRRAAQHLAGDCQQLRWSPSPDLAQLSRLLETTYRQGNIQLSVSESLINRLLPNPAEQTSPIDSQIMGIQTSGQATTRAGLKILLLPDESRWHIGIEANGVIQSQTRSQSGGATFINNGESTFRVKSQLLISQQQLQVTPAIAEVESNSELADIKTEYDSMPLLGGIARNMARNQYRKKSRGSVEQLKREVAQATENALNQQITERLGQVDQFYRQQWLTPLDRLELAPTVVAMQTRDERLQVQYRIASQQQLAGYGRQPELPAGSLMHLRMHESAINNLLDQFELNGRRASLPELWNHVGTVLGTELAVPEELPENVVVELASGSAVRVRFQDGQFQLQLNIRSLDRKQEALWRNFSIVAAYRPDAEGTMIRDGHLSVIGKSIRLGDRVALQGIFNKVFSRLRPIRVLDQQLVDQLDAAEAMIGQAVIQHGWLSVAVVDRPAQSAE
jgi:hypothetical protein